MRFPEQSFRLSNGAWCVLRSPEPEDAGRRAEYLRRVNGETEYMARGAKDSPSDVALIAQMIEDQAEDEAVLEIAAWVDGEMIACGGIAPISRGYPRRRHRASLGVAVLREYWSLGIGHRMMSALIREASAMDYLQIELSVSAENDRAQRLYAQFGFQTVGRIPRAQRLEDGSFQDELEMCLEL